MHDYLTPRDGQSFLPADTPENMRHYQHRLTASPEENPLLVTRVLPGHNLFVLIKYKLSITDTGHF